MVFSDFLFSSQNCFRCFTRMTQIGANSRKKAKSGAKRNGFLALLAPLGAEQRRPVPAVACYGGQAASGSALRFSTTIQVSKNYPLENALQRLSFRSIT